MNYRDTKNAILADGNFLRESDDELLKTWFWAGVSAAVRVHQKIRKINIDPLLNKED